MVSPAGQPLAQTGGPAGPALDGGAYVVRGADHHHALAGPRDGGVEELAGEQPRLRWRQDHDDLVGLWALALVDGQRGHGVPLAEAAGGPGQPAAAARP